MQSPAVVVDSIVLANEIAKVSPGPEEGAKGNIEPEQAVGKAKHLEVDSPERNFGEVLPSRFIWPKLAFVAVAANFLKDPGKRGAFLSFLWRRQFAERFRDYSGRKHIQTARPTTVRRKPIGFLKEPQAQ